MDLVCVLSLNYNQSEMTLQFINSVLNSNYGSFKIIIADNGSEQEDANALEKGIKGKEKIVFERIQPNRGYVGGMNYLLKKAKSFNPGYYLVMNNDTNIDPNAISEFVKTAQDYDNNCIVTGKIYEFDEPNKIQTLGSICIDKRILKYQNIGIGEIDTGQFDQRQERDMIDDVYWLLPNKVFQETGLYSELFSFNGESADYALRAKKAGFKLIYCPTAKLWHKGSLSVGGRKNNPYISYWQTRSTLTFRYLHLEPEFFKIFYYKRVLLIINSYLKNIRNLVLFKKTTFNLSNAAYRGLKDFNKFVKKEGK